MRAVDLPVSEAGAHAARRPLEVSELWHRLPDDGAEAGTTVAALVGPAWNVGVVALDPINGWISRFS